MKQLKELNFYSMLSTDQQNDLLNNSKVEKYKQNEIIYDQGDKCKNVTLVLEGTIFSAKLLFSGKIQKIKEINVGEILGEAILFSNKNYPVSIISKGNSKIAKIEKGKFLLLLDDKMLLEKYLTEMSKKVLNLSNVIELISLSNIKQRIAKFVFNEYNKKNSKILNLGSKSEIAKKLGTSREVISRNMKKLIETKIIIQRDEENYEILNFNLLEEILYT